MHETLQAINDLLTGALIAWSIYYLCQPPPAH